MSITGEWVPWSAKVPQIEVETHKVAAPDVVVPTLDTVRHEALLYTWLAEHKPLGNSQKGLSNFLNSFRHSATVTIAAMAATGLSP